MGAPMLSSYYQVMVPRDRIWFVTGCLRNEDHWTFDRALEGTTNVLEVFVAPSYEEAFCALMDFFRMNGEIFSYEKLPNRFEIPSTLS